MRPFALCTELDMSHHRRERMRADVIPELRIIE
jgi:hypothetical protein